MLRKCKGCDRWEAVHLEIYSETEANLCYDCRQRFYHWMRTNYPNASLVTMSTRDTNVSIEAFVKANHIDQIFVFR